MKKMWLRPFSRRLVISVEGVVYQNTAIACRALGITNTKLKSRLESPHYPNWFIPEHVEPVAIVYYNQHYTPEFKTAAKEAKVSVSTIRKAVQDSRKKDAYVLYANGERSKDLQNPNRLPDNPPIQITERYTRRSSYSVDGVKMQTRLDAAKVLGIHPSTLTKRICGKSRDMEIPHYCIAGQLYCTISEAVESLSIQPSTIYRRMQSDSFPDYYRLKGRKNHAAYHTNSSTRHT